MQICEYFFENACYSVTKYYLCRQNNKRTFFSSKQRHKAFRSFPNRYQFSCINKVTSLFSISCILIIILPCKRASFDFQSLKFIYKTEEIKEGYTSTCASLFSYHSSVSHHLIVFYSFKNESGKVSVGLFNMRRYERISRSNRRVLYSLGFALAAC